MKTRDLAYCGLFGSLALALPTLFHAFGLAGMLFLPMYWPLVTLAFLVPARRAVLVAALVPFASSILTGMPLMWPPLVAVMSVELVVQVLLLGLLRRAWSRVRQGEMCATAILLGGVLVLGRFVHAGLVGLLAQKFQLPAGVVAGASLLAGWPGVVCMLAVVPAFVGATARRDGVCEVRFLKALRRLHLPEGVVLACAQVLRWFEALGRDAEQLARALELRRAVGGAREVRPVAIAIENLRVVYPGREEPALALDRLEIASGEKVALLGPNGSGKTTLLSVLAGFTAYAGTVKLDGLEPRGKDLKALRRRMGVLFENPDDQFLFPTLREDVGHALEKRGLSPAERSARVDELLTAVGLETGNRPIAALSRGQRQRAALAGLLAAEPDLLILDEPTAALDDVEKERLAAVLRVLPATLIVATHDRSFATALGARVLTLVPSGRT